MPAESEAQRRYLNWHFGHQWVKQHHFDNKGPLPQHLAHGGVAGHTMKHYSNKSGIHINPAHKGEFTAKAKKAGSGVQAYANKVLSAPKGQYPASTRRQANFARNARGFNH